MASEPASAVRDVKGPLMPIEMLGPSPSLKVIPPPIFSSCLLRLPSIDARVVGLLR